MKAVEGERIEGLGFQTKWLGDLLEFEGPLISLVEDLSQEGRHYLYKWVDVNDHQHRWAVIPLAAGVLDRFLFGQVTLREIVFAPAETYLVDMDATLQVRQVLRLKPESLPEDYLPEEDSYFKEASYSSYAAALRDARARAGPPPDERTS
jgi:hypothetical protein